MAIYIVTFDLKNASSADYATASAFLAKLGLHQTTPNNVVFLPNNTYAGRTSGDADVLRNALQLGFARLGLSASSLLVAQVSESDWSAWGQKVAA